jgi:hypothetical protein
LLFCHGAHETAHLCHGTHEKWDSRNSLFWFHFHKGLCGSFKAQRERRGPIVRERREEYNVKEEQNEEEGGCG